MEEMNSDFRSITQSPILNNRVYRETHNVSSEDPSLGVVVTCDHALYLQEKNKGLIAG